MLRAPSWVDQEGACPHLSRLLCYRNKCGIWGWRSEKMETVSGYEAKAGGAAGRGTWGQPCGTWRLSCFTPHAVEGEGESVF